LLSIIPYTSAAIARLTVGHHSDVKRERRWHFALCGTLGAAAFAASSVRGVPGGIGLAAILSGSAAAAGIAWINCVGNLATIRDRTHSMTLALLALSTAALASVLISLYVTRRPGHNQPTCAPVQRFKCVVAAALAWLGPGWFAIPSPV
jgi:hypothetical protein